MSLCDSCWHSRVCKNVGTRQCCVHYAQFSSYVFVPCELGTTVYIVTSSGVLPAVVDKLAIRPGNELRVRVVFYCEGAGLVWRQQSRYYSSEDFGKKVFLCAEDAQCVFDSLG